jgi:hypothetical protein
MATKIKRHADEDQASAVDDWASDVERDHQCRVRIIIYPTGAKGRLSIRVEACDISGDRLVGVRVRRATSYPNSYGTSLCGVLIKELMALGADLESYKAFAEGVSSNPAV